MKDVKYLESLEGAELQAYKAELLAEANRKMYPVRYILTITPKYIVLTFQIKGAEFNPLMEANYIDHKSDKQGFGLQTLRGLTRTDSKDVFSYTYINNCNTITLVVPNSYLISDTRKLDNCFIDVTVPYKSTYFADFEVDEKYPSDLSILNTTYEVANYSTFIAEMLLNYVYYNEVPVQE